MIWRSKEVLLTDVNTAPGEARKGRRRQREEERHVRTEINS